MFQDTTMATRYRSHDTEDVLATQDSAPLDLVPPETPYAREREKDSSDEYCEETDTPTS